MKQITSEEYKKIREENPDILTSINGVLNTVVGAAEGTFNMTLSPKDLETLKTQPIQRISIHNPTNGGIADIIGCAIGKVGVVMNTDIGTKDLTKIVKADPTILRGVIAHSQATIKFTQVLKELGKTEEGRKLIKENVGTIAIAAPAVGESTLNELKELVGEDKLKILINEEDFINYITNNDPTTSGEKKHGSKNYNIHMEKGDKELYIRPEELKYDVKDKDGNPVLDKEGNQVKGNILGKIEVFNDEKTKTVIQEVIEKIREKRREKK